MKRSKVQNPVGYIVFGVYISIFSVLYFTSYKVMTSWWKRGDYNYCYLIPFIVLYLLWEKRSQLSVTFSKPSWWGIIPLMLGVCFFWLGELGGEFYTLYLSSWFVLVGLCWLHLGWEKLKVIRFPLFIILTMFPPPNFIYERLSLKLKLLSSQLGVWLMQMWGMSAYREGNIIDLGFTRLQVVDACSGLRYLFPLIVLAILLAYFYKDSLWKRIVLVLSAIPLSIVTNALRIALTGVLYEVWGAKVAEGFFHGFSGWFIFMFSFLILVLEMKVLSFKFYKVLGFKFYVLGKTGGRKQEERETGEEESGRSQQADETKRDSKARIAVADNLKPNHLKPKTFPAQFIVAVLLLGSTLALSNGVEFREKIPMTRSFSEFPLKVDGWTGTREFMEQKFVDTLDLSDYIIVDYKNKEGKIVNFYVAYYESQRKGESIHSPSTCLPMSGWIFKQAGEITIQTPGYYGGYMRVRRAFMEKSGLRQVLYYWFPQRGRILTNAYQLKIYNFWDALTKHRTDGALVRIITPVYENESVRDADKRLQEFVRHVVPILDDFLPK